MNNLWRQRLSLLLLGAFGIIALALAVTGTYGAISHAVSLRTQEIGIRMAVGAVSADVLLLSIRQALAPVAIGVGAGLAMSLILTRLMTTMLCGVQATDPITFIGVAAIMALSGLFAAFLPALRAARVDPMTALLYRRLTLRSRVRCPIPRQPVHRERACRRAALVPSFFR